MQSIFNYIISTNNRYNNKTVVGNKELILNTEITERDYMFVNRIGVVENLPIAFKTNIREKDKVIVHHNVFRRWIDQSGSERDSANFLKENKYSVSEDQIFAYNRNGIWECLPEYCFVQPIYKKGAWSLKTDENLKGVLVYSNKELSSLGASVGDVVGFTPDSEYEFIIEGKKLYRILSNHITLNYGPEEKSN